MLLYAKEKLQKEISILEEEKRKEMEHIHLLEEKENYIYDYFFQKNLLSMLLKLSFVSDLLLVSFLAAWIYGQFSYFSPSLLHSMEFGFSIFASASSTILYSYVKKKIQENFKDLINEKKNTLEEKSNRYNHEKSKALEREKVLDEMILNRKEELKNLFPSANQNDPYYLADTEEEYQFLLRQRKKASEKYEQIYKEMKKPENVHFIPETIEPIYPTKKVKTKTKKIVK